jgi:hypothetical protein
VSIEDDGGAGPGDHVAVALFSTGQTISRADCSIQLFEFLCFCTAKDTMVVGGLEKLLSTFVRDVAGRGEGDGSGVDVVTSIDCDSGHGDRWPKVISMEGDRPGPDVCGQRWRGMVAHDRHGSDASKTAATTTMTMEDDQRRERG